MYNSVCACAADGCVRVQVVLDELGQHHVPVVTDWHLNERCYGALVGKNKKECVRVYGEEQVKLWRRSFDVRPPPIR
jgi:2,3-bisphosphoglycerate-dependent phosphoglycerate mutase